LLVFLPAAQERRNAGGDTCPTDAKDRKERGHFGNRNRDRADVVDWCAHVRATASCPLGSETAGGELIGGSNDGELADQLSAGNRSRAVVCPGQVRQGSIIGWVNERRIYARIAGRKCPVCGLEGGPGGEGAEVVDGEEIARVNLLVNRDVDAIIPEETAGG